MSEVKKRLKEFVEGSFLSPLLALPTVTDISYNGERIFYEDKEAGRKMFQTAISKTQVGDFLRQIANYSEKQFSYMNPILDVSFSRYRLNATYLSLTRVKDDKSYSFSLRIGEEGTAIAEEDAYFWGGAKNFLLEALCNKESIVIAGETGAGKTELQKYLLLHLPPFTRVIVIDNVEELELSRGSSELDLTSWLVDDRLPSSSFPSLIRNALRNNPDYLLVAESRGAEMLDALHAVMSGHPIITTLHAESLISIPERIARMVMMAGEKLVYEETLADVYSSFSFLVYLGKDFIGGKVKRRIEAVGRINRAAKRVDVLFEAEGIAK